MTLIYILLIGIIIIFIFDINSAIYLKNHNGIFIGEIYGNKENKVKVVNTYNSINSMYVCFYFLSDKYKEHYELDYDTFLRTYPKRIRKTFYNNIENE